MSIAIIGGGLAGLASAIKARIAFPNNEVVLVEKRSPQSNTQIAGQRIRAGIAGRRQDPVAEINHLFASRNDGVLTPQMELFSQLSVKELGFWHSFPGFVNYEDRPEWFGPQWGVPNKGGGGRGKSVLDWYRKAAKECGVTFLQGEVLKLIINSGYTEGVLLNTDVGFHRLNADTYILAAGNISGRLFLSTNKDIANSAQEMAFDAGLSLVDSTLHMIHPFGNCDTKGNPRIGCFETDTLSGVKVYLDGTSNTPIYDRETTELLLSHQAHYHFPQIAKRFREHGGIVLLEYPDGNRDYARVSHHYGHIGIDTIDGVSVRGVTNLLAVGDASGIGYWTNHRERFPGFALLKCIIDAELVVRRIHSTDYVPESRVQLSAERDVRNTWEERDSKDYLRELKHVNSHYLEQWLMASTNTDKGRIGQDWLSGLNQRFGIDHDTILAVSKAAAYAHWKIGAGEEKEPLKIDNSCIVELYAEQNIEVRRSVKSPESDLGMRYNGGKEKF